MDNINFYLKFNKTLINTMVTSVRLVNSEDKENKFDNKVDLSQITHTFSPSSLTPFTKSLYQSIASIDKNNFLIDIGKDQPKINKSLMVDVNDPYNEVLTKSKLGFYMEDYLCDKLVCPYCNGKLYKFVNQNMPMVDLICENAKQHVIEKNCCLWQVKTTVESFDYFDKSRGFISIPNNQYSIIVLTPHQDFSYLQLGFICIFLNTTTDEHRYKINYNNSFFLKPLTDSFRCYSFSSDIGNKIAIRWEPTCFLSDINLPNIGKIVDTNEVYSNTLKYKNPLDLSNNVLQFDI